MKSEKLIKELYRIRLKEYELNLELNVHFDVTPRILQDLRWILEIEEFKK